jgi:hypothetical protein
VRDHYLHERIWLGEFDVPSKMLADIFTKPLQGNLFEREREGERERESGEL